MMFRMGSGLQTEHDAIVGAPEKPEGNVDKTAHDATTEDDLETYENGVS